ncbi:hypothetical protein BC826DRAFT_418649 [Russula brevipes]|nr:hypothetical protein BC826DRAFT_418649 [Russula brevipes]
MHGEVVSLFRLGGHLNFNNFSRGRAHSRIPCDLAALMTHRFTRWQLDSWIGSILRKNFNYKKAGSVGLCHMSAGDVSILVRSQYDGHKLIFQDCSLVAVLDPLHRLSIDALQHRVNFHFMRGRALHADCV